MKNSRRNQALAAKVNQKPPVSKFAAKRAAERAAERADSPFAILATLEPLK